MKLKQIIAALLLITGAKAAFSQETEKMAAPGDHRVIMQVTESDSLTQLAVIGQIRNIKRSLPDTRMEVVCHANALDLVLLKGSKVQQHIQELRLMGVNFIACENTMARRKVAAKDLLPGIQTVPSGLVEIILRQEDGWSYIKGGY